jgi:hypothetical protein
MCAAALTGKMVNTTSAKIEATIPLRESTFARIHFLSRLKSVLGISQVLPAVVIVASSKKIPRVMTSF